MWQPPWYRDFNTGERVRMKYLDPPLFDEHGRQPIGVSTTTVEGILLGFSMEPIEGYPFNAHPHAVSLIVEPDGEFEHRAPINRIIELHPIEPATVEI